jgi:hypothetical protein
MEIFFHDPEDIPLPPKNVRIRQFQVEPWSDGRRVSVYLELTPFQQKPNGEISVVDAEGNEVANLTIIETIDPKNEFTIHLRGADVKGEYTAKVNIFYAELEHENDSGDQGQEGKLRLPSTHFTVVDRSQATFTID